MKYTNGTTEKIVVPECLRAYILRMHHNIQLAGHQGQKRVLEQIRDVFFWPGLKQDVIRWVRSCLACTRRKTPRPMRAGITEPVLASYPNQTLAMDIVGPMHCSLDGNMWILTMIDQFTRWPVAVPIPDRTSAAIAKAVFDHWKSEKGVPYLVISDRGRELISKGMMQLCAKLGIHKVSTSGYNPTGNSAIERFHRYLGTSLCILYDKRVADWDTYLKAVLYSYRASTNDTTGYSPFFLETGREPNLPMHTLFPFLSKSEPDEEAYVSNIAQKLNFAFNKARELQTEAARRNQELKCTNKYNPDFKEGDWLLVWEKSANEGRLQGPAAGKGEQAVSLPNKLRNPWQGPYKMVRWSGERKCVVQKEGKEVEYNVNRLTKQYPWDDDHLDTSQKLDRKEEEEENTDRNNGLKTDIQIGEVVVFQMAITETHRAPFGAGRVLQVRNSEDIVFQWIGNPRCNPRGTWQNGWIDPKDNKGYYAKNKMHKSHSTWTNDATETPMGLSELIAKGFDLIDSGNCFTKKARKIISNALKPMDVWGDT